MNDQDNYLTVEEASLLYSQEARYEIWAYTGYVKKTGPITGRVILGMENGHIKRVELINNMTIPQASSIKSPFVSNGIALLLIHSPEMKYKGREATCPQFYFECQRTKQSFTTDDIDELNIKLVKTVFKYLPE